MSAAGDEQPRLAPLSEDEWGEAEYDAFGAVLGVPGDRAPRAGSGHRLDPMRFAVVGTMARNPQLAKAFLTFNRYQLNDSSLPARLRELSILRVALQRRSRYEWGQHVKLALDVGITHGEISTLARGNEGFDGADLVVLEATDELLGDGRLGDETWARLNSVLDERDVMELIFVVGTYSLLAMAFESWRLQPEADTPVLPDPI